MSQSSRLSRLAMMVPAVPAPRMTMRVMRALPSWLLSREGNIATPLYGHIEISAKRSSRHGPSRRLGPGGSPLRDSLARGRDGRGGFHELGGLRLHGHLYEIGRASCRERV